MPGLVHLSGFGLSGSVQEGLFVQSRTDQYSSTVPSGSLGPHALKVIGGTPRRDCDGMIWLPESSAHIPARGIPISLCP